MISRSGVCGLNFTILCGVRLTLSNNVEFGTELLCAVRPQGFAFAEKTHPPSKARIKSDLRCA